MKTYQIIAVLLASVFLSNTLLAQDEKKDAKIVDPSGTWHWEYDMQGETAKDRAVLQLGKGGKVTGKLYSTLRESVLKVKNGKMKGDKLTFETTAEFDGTEVELEFIGKIKGDKLTGEVLADAGGQTMEFPWAPERKVQLLDVVGEWDIVYEMDGNEIEAKLTVTKKGKEFKGVQSGDNIGEIPAQNLKVKDNHLTYKIEFEYDGADVVGMMKGRPYGNIMKGAVELDADGSEFELPFVAKRKVKKKKAKKESDKKKEE